MSYDINFWKQSAGFSRAPQEIYEQLCDGKPVDGLVDLPVHEFLARIKAVFPGTTENAGTLDFDSENSGAFQVSWPPQHVRVDCYQMPGEEMNKFIDIAAEFGCPLYDPQTGERFEGE